MKYIFLDESKTIGAPVKCACVYYSMLSSLNLFRSGLQRVFMSQGVNLWSSSAQNPLTRIVTDPEQEVVVTSDSAGTINTWQGRTGELLSAFSSGSSQCTLMTFSTEGNSFVMVNSVCKTLSLQRPYKCLKLTHTLSHTRFQITSVCNLLYLGGNGSGIIPRPDVTTAVGNITPRRVRLVQSEYSPLIT